MRRVPFDNTISSKQSQAIKKSTQPLQRWVNPLADQYLGSSGKLSGHAIYADEYDALATCQ